MRNWKRRYRLEITLPDGTLWDIDSQTTDLRISFSSSQSLKREPDQTTITIFNLNAEFRARLHNSRKSKLVLSAGYEDHMDVIFKGDVSQAYSKQDDTGVTWLTTITAGAGEVRYQTAKVNLSFAKTQPRIDIIRKVAVACGYNTSLLPKIEGLVDSVENMGTLVRGVALTGGGVAVLAGLLPAGWSFTEIKDQLFLHGPSTLKPGPRLLIDTVGSGLIGTPEVSTKDTQTGKVTLKVLTQLNPQATPGMGMEINMPEFKGETYRVEQVDFVGDSWSGAWTSEFHCKKI